MIPEEIEYNKQVQIHAELLRAMSDYTNMMRGREPIFIENRMAM